MFCAVLCSVLCCVLCCTALCTVLYCTAYCTVLCCTVYCTVLYCAALCTVLYCTVLCCTVYCTVLCCMFCVLRCAVMHGIVLHVHDVVLCRCCVLNLLTHYWHLCLPISISSSVSTSPMHSNLNSLRTWAKLLCALERSKIIEHASYSPEQ